ncbi:NAD(P)H-binding protein [Micromonospora sp. DR5-3]|uniref:SDR family oxidoreductase n=1 Tax=unclassified Micromonospora TaxID=2617518 RepID=UPI0011D36653|nr:MULTISPECIES: NAD(P)H-binding protein [unclassified Micromonospora]MCW3818234.1 NAD(P)H-binding protein [Micromonospora sp. DR5-3]TYC21680.1 NAD(P)H-binding protein [Micromonospora sp. MP36]
MIVVTGATGNVGRPLVRALAAAGEQVTAVSRQVAPAEQPPGVRVVPADLTDPAGLKPAFDGADALFLLLTGELLTTDPGDLLAAARDAGVRRVVLLSSQGVGTRRYPPHVEEAVRASGLEWTVLRPSGFHTNTLAWAEAVRGARMVAAPFGDVGLPFVDPADVAEVAAVALRGDGHGAATYELTGPAPVTPRQQAAAIGEALGEPVRFVELSHAEARERMLPFMPEPVVATTLSILGTPSPAEQRVSPDVERLLGRAPGTFADWAARNVAAFR